MFTRRSFLKTSSLVSLSPLVPSMLTAAARAAGPSADERVLVVIQLDGGNDGLNTVVPYSQDGYARARRKLRLKTDELHKLDGQAGLHPAMKAAKQLFDDGRLAVIQNVGYPNPNRSHFSSMRIWQTAELDESLHNSYGWLGRALDDRAARTAAGAEVAALAREPGAVFVGDRETPVALWSRRSSATSLTRIEDVLLERPVAAQTEPPAADKNGAERGLHQFVEHEMLSAYRGADELKRRQSKSVAHDGKQYAGGELGARLKTVAELLKGGSAARVYYTIHSGFDTHAAQLFTHATLLRDFSDAVASFLKDLRGARLDDRVAVLAFSEFGRRVEENDSEGTDHGAAAPVFLAGTPVRGGVLGTPPDLDNLVDGDIRMGIDFRQVYASLLDQWLGASSQQVLGTQFDRLDLLNTAGDKAS